GPRVNARVSGQAATLFHAARWAIQAQNVNLPRSITALRAAQRSSRGNRFRMEPMQRLPGLEGTVYSTILADPPWQFQNRTGKVAPEHKRLARYRTMSRDEICALPVAAHADEPSHLYLWCPNALLEDGLAVMKAWGFRYKTNIVWYKI